MARKRQTYPPARTGRPPARPGAGPEAVVNRPNLASINTSAGKGRSGFSVGDTVRVAGGGRYAGEIGVIERITTGAVPSAVVRIASGEAGQVRTIDLEPMPAQD